VSVPYRPRSSSARATVIRMVGITVFIVTDPVLSNTTFVASNMHGPPTTISVPVTSPATRVAAVMDAPR
jgi:hypothetical protein